MKFLSYEPRKLFKSKILLILLAVLVAVNVWLLSSIALQKIVSIATHVVSDVEFIAKNAIILKKGYIQTIAKPEELMASMENKVWTADVPENMVPAFEKVVRITSIQKNDSSVTLRMLSDLDISEYAAPAKPTLEDYYLYVFGKEEEEK